MSVSFPLSTQRLSQQTRMLQSILHVANNAFAGHLSYNEAMALPTCMPDIGTTVQMHCQSCCMRYAGAFFKDQGIQYTCVAGQLVAGNKEAANRSLAKYACNSYREVHLSPPSPPRPPLRASYLPTPRI